MMWVFPYFMETYITHLMPEMEMSDYKINYTNHEMYRSINGRKEGSPVRFLTNISLRYSSFTPLKSQSKTNINFNYFQFDQSSKIGGIQVLQTL